MNFKVKKSLKIENLKKRKNQFKQMG